MSLKNITPIYGDDGRLIAVEDNTTKEQHPATLDNPHFRKLWEAREKLPDSDSKKFAETKPVPAPDLDNEATGFHRSLLVRVFARALKTLNPRLTAKEIREAITAAFKTERGG